jgi:hypothetical protein
MLSSHAPAFMEQLKARGIEPGDSTTESLVAVKAELVEEKAAREKAQCHT